MINEVQKELDECKIKLQKAVRLLCNTGKCPPRTLNECIKEGTSSHCYGTDYEKCWENYLNE
jgi:hypothetical protein